MDNVTLRAPCRTPGATTSGAGPRPDAVMSGLTTTPYVIVRGFRTRTLMPLMGKRHLLIRQGPWVLWNLEAKALPLVMGALWRRGDTWFRGRPSSMAAVRRSTGAWSIDMPSEALGHTCSCRWSCPFCNGVHCLHYQYTTLNAIQINSVTPIHAQNKSLTTITCT